MSISRQLFNEFRPFFRLLEEPLGRTPASLYNIPSTFQTPDAFTGGFVRPAVDLREEGDQYIVDADLPGIKKENLEVRIGDSGRSITIEGKVFEGPKATPTEDKQSAEPIQKTDTQAVSKSDQQNAVQLSSERPYTRNFSFTRTVWLPRPVDPTKVSAKLDHGVLTVAVKKTEDKATTTIPID
ncbi:HSP20-like chaperone [Cyathus striatus]|nr:HSP20-like chaperone [Cyathus striatus]